MISVIVPYRNSEKWLGRCIDSLKAQEEEAQFLLINDHSDDKSDNVALAHIDGDTRFIMLDNRRQPGVSGARNTGLDIAKGDWITFLDSDDEMLPYGLGIYEALIRANKTYRIYQTNHLRYYAPINKTALKYTNTEGAYGLDELPVMWCMVWNKVYRADLIRDNGIRFDELMKYGEDELFNLKCLAIEKQIYHSPDDIATVKRHFDNKHSLVHSKSAEDLFRQAERLMSFISKHEDPEIRTAVCRLLSEHWGSDTYLGMFGNKGGK